MNSKKFFEEVTGLKPNNEILNIMDNLNYGYDFEKSRAPNQSLKDSLINLAEKVSNKETSFFRDEEVFEIIKKKILKDKMKIWSAGCSYGQEPYSLALLRDNIIQNKDFKIYATDISQSVIESGRKGNFSIYRKDEKKRINKFLPFLSKTFKIDNLNNLKIQIPNLVKRQINFYQHNLLDEPPTIKFDFIMCRNVLIYMNNESRIRIFKNLQKAIKPMGWLAMGSADPKPPKLWKMHMINNTIFWQFIG